MTRRVLIAGCGDVGIALGKRLARSGSAVYGLRRNPGALPSPIQGVAADLGDPGSLRNLRSEWDCVVYCPTPGERTPAAYRRVFVAGLENLASRVETGRLLFVSSTAVYGQDDGSRVDETSETNPARFNGRVLLQAETIAAERFEQGIAVRFAGIYGPGRDRLIRLVRQGGVTAQAEPPQWTNRIHRDDCAALLHWLLDLRDPQPVYVGVDDEPAPKHEVLGWLARALGAPQPKRTFVPGGPRNKRLDNQRIRSTGFRFRYPDYRSGYGALIESSGGRSDGMGELSNGN